MEGIPETAGFAENVFTLMPSLNVLPDGTRKLMTITIQDMDRLATPRKASARGAHNRV